MPPSLSVHIASSKTTNIKSANFIIDYKTQYIITANISGYTVYEEGEVSHINVFGLVF